MYFKRLELYGFKSFAEKTRLDFEPGITAVVGPNGCGKSNIADSIKWVLGEQSAKMLRGGKMEDVIFNGTDGREPINFAEVSLTLDNKDRMLPIEYDEVTVSRRLYRSGESEYLLNKTPVRLKDINELFMGTGIGTSAYSLIEQGRIDQVLSSKPEERREVFEEASGITKFKAKKREALKRLDDTEQNLVRINDIILEVKRQIASIERQAKKAERYKERYEELKALELRLTRINLETLSQNLTHSNTDLDSLKARENELETKLTKTKNELYDLTSKRSSIENSRMELKSGVMQLESDISKSIDKTSLNKERIEELKARRVELASEIEKNKESIISQEKEVAILRQKVGLLESQNLEKASSLSGKEKKLGEVSKAINENETIISTSKANLLDIASNEARLRNQKSKISANLSTHDARSKRLEIEKSTIQEEKNSLESKLEGILKEQKVLEDEVYSIKSQKTELTSSFIEIVSNIKNIINQLEEATRSITINRSRLEVLEEAKAKYEGFSAGVRAILSRDKNDPSVIIGIKDVLANLLSVEKGYELAIEAALGDYLQSIVVDTPEAIDNALNYLKEDSCGKASFIHAASFNDIDSVNEGLEDERILGRAISFCRIDEQYKNIPNNLLKNIFIVKDLQDGRELLNSISRKDITFVSLRGEIAANGYISGGDISQEEDTLVNRDIKIKEFGIKINEEEGRINALQVEKISNESRRSDIEKRSQELSNILSEKEISLANVSTSREHVEENVNTVSDEISLVSLELDEVTSEIASLKEEEISVDKSIKDAEKDFSLNNSRISDSERLLGEYIKEKEQLLIETAEERTELGSLESRKEGLFSTLQILESSLNDAEQSMRTKKSEIESSISKVEELAKDISSLDGSIVELSDKRDKSVKELEEIEVNYKALSVRISEVENSNEEFEKEINELRNNFHQADIKKVETNYGMDNIKQRIRDVYKVDLGETELPEGWQDIDIELLKKDVDDKRERLDSMGTVNLVAIEEHTELQDRYQFLTHQRDDLANAKDSLLKAIDKINKTTKELFIETFKSIQVEFKSFFKMLFGGGEGDLILLDEGNVLESGIEIVARPPGKRLQNVSLLSGGEKALTAISLIFAIFKVKPSPFCVLDEIDAPLDESNVDRFSRSLDMFTNTSQFIVITHNKKTIDMADVMYGITMQQSGISKVVSVKFHDANKEKVAEDVPA
ncbi:MAG: chromosome segregation protein SMC [Candidatus Omnitrophota bacterium]